METRNGVKQESTYVFPDEARQQKTCCGRKCCIITLIVLLLIVTFVTLPAGVMLIVHGRHKEKLWLQIFGSVVVSVPIVASIIIVTIIYLRRRSQRMGQSAINSNVRV